MSKPKLVKFLLADWADGAHVLYSHLVAGSVYFEDGTYYGIAADNEHVIVGCDLGSGVYRYLASHCEREDW